MMLSSDPFAQLPSFSQFAGPTGFSGMSPMGGQGFGMNSLVAGDGMGPQQQRHHGMFGGAWPMFGLAGLLSQSGMGLSPMFGLAGMGLHSLGLFK